MNKRVVFVVQGEGRGHLSQALAMQEVVRQMDLHVCAVFVGRSNQRKKLPAYFTNAFEGLITEFESPNFLHDKNGKGIKVTESLVLSAIKLPKYIWIANELANRVKKTEADLIINFYEPLIGLSQLYNRIKSPIVCIAHQYLSMHPKFEMPPKPAFDKNGLKVLSRISQFGSTLNMALSFYPFQDWPNKKIKVVPPLLRSSIKHLEISDGNYYLIYILNSGYAEDVIAWHKTNLSVELHCFWDGFDKPNPYIPQENLYFHHLSDTKFLEMMAGCKALLTTAGFESVSEAMYLEKPVAMVPVKGHYEQKVNSYDAVKGNAGVRADDFDLEILFHKLEKFSFTNENFSKKLWIESSASKIKSELARLLA